MGFTVNSPVGNLAISNHYSASSKITFRKLSHIYELFAVWKIDDRGDTSQWTYKKHIATIAVWQLIAPNADLSIGAEKVVTIFARVCQNHGLKITNDKPTPTMQAAFATGGLLLGAQLQCHTCTKASPCVIFVLHALD